MGNGIVLKLVIASTLRSSFSECGNAAGHRVDLARQKETSCRESTEVGVDQTWALQKLTTVAGRC